MIEVEQTRFGVKGNCMAACIASIMELSLDEVPNCDGGAYGGALMQWFAERNLSLVSVPIVRWKGESASYYYSGYVILNAKSPRNEGNHAVVVHDGRIVWDPHPQREMGVGRWQAYQLFLTLDPARHKIFSP